MANSNNPRGAIPIKHLNGSPYNGQANEYFIPSTDATAVYIGDPVKLAGSAAADGTPTVAVAAGGDTIIGFVVGFRPDPTNLGLNYRPASTSRYLLVEDSPDVIFEMQEDSVGGALATTNTGNTVDFITGTGSTISGLSGAMVDSSTAGTGSANLLLHRVVKREDNDFGAYAKWEVRIVEHQYTTAGGV